MVFQDRPESAVDESIKPRRKRFLARFRRNKNKHRSAANVDGDDSKAFEEPSEEDREAATPTPPCTPPPRVVNTSISNGGRVDIPPPLVSASKLPTRSFVQLHGPPSARDAAFQGPPRYDWIDIETAAAIKVQAAFRRNKVLKELEEQGISTVATRNRSRRRNKKPSLLDGNLFACCGMGLAFGGDDEYNHREHDREQYVQRHKERRARENELISSFGKSYLKKRYQRGDVDEAVEIVE